MSRNRHHLAVFDDPGRIFPAFFEGPGFVVVSSVCEIPTNVSGPATGPEFIGGKMKVLIALGSGASVSAIYKSGLSKVYRSRHTSRMTSSCHNSKGRVN